MNWSYQGTKACSVLVGENTDAKPSSGEANKTSTSSTSTSSQSSGRTRPQSSSGGSINTSDSMLLDGVVYSRKRRDTFNEHALHQTVAPPPSRDPEELSLTTVAEAEISGFEQRSVLLHEESPSKVVHDPEHVDGQSSVRGAIDRSIKTAKDAPPESSGSTTPSRVIQLVVNVSSTATNYSHHHLTHTTIAVDHLASSSSVSVGSDNSLASASVRQSPPNETFGMTSRSSQDTSAKYTPKFAAAHGNVHVASKAPFVKLSRDDSADFGRDIDNVGTSESSDFVESSGGTEATTSASGSESTKLGADSSDYSQVVGGTAENGRNVFPVDYSDNIDDSTIEPTTVTEIRLNELTEDHQSNVSNSDSSRELVPVEANQEEVDASTVLPSTTVDNKMALNTLPNKDENVEKLEDVAKAEDSDDVFEEKINLDENERLAIFEKNNSILKTTNMIANSESFNIVKETRELSREFSSSEFVASSNLAKTSDQSEELQRDYPVPIYSYGQDDVEIVDLQDKKQPVETAKAELSAKSSESMILNNGVKMNAALRQEWNKDNVRIIEREKNDEEFLQKFKKQFHEASTDADESVENSPSIKTNYNSPPTDTLHETVHDSLGNASPRFPSRSDPPMIQRVQVVEVPVYRDPSQPSSSSSSFSSSSHRVLINVTIATEDSSAVSSKPLYILSVSVPTESGVISHSSGINVDQAQMRTAERLSEPSAASMKKIPANDNESIDAVDTRLPPPPQPPASPPAPIWAGGECECSCPCMGSSSDEWDNFSAIDDEDLEQELESINSTLLAENSFKESGERLTDKKDGKLSSKDSVRPDATSTIEDYYPSSTDIAESGESTNETSASTYEPEVSTDACSCSGSTPLPPEPTILILEGEAPFLLFFSVNLTFLNNLSYSLPTSLLSIFRLR